MTDTTPATQHSFALQKTVTDPTRLPLEVYHLSHDLRGPLNSMLGFCELLLEGIEGPLNEVQQTDIGAVYQSAQNLLNLVNTMVDLSKLEANRLNFNFLPVQMDQLLQGLVAAGFGTTKPEQIEVIINLDPALPPVWADQDRVEQMLKALFRAAFRLKRKGQITVGAAPGDTQEVILQVDLGAVDLAEAEWAELFELVVKVDPSGRSELGPGGLDLPLVRSLAEKQQGRVGVEQRGEQEISLYLSLPRPEPAARGETP